MVEALVRNCATSITVRTCGLGSYVNTGVPWITGVGSSVYALIIPKGTFPGHQESLDAIDAAIS